MRKFSKKALESANVICSGREYTLKNTVTGRYVYGVVYEYVLEHVPGKVRKQRVPKKAIGSTADPRYHQMCEITEIMESIISNGLEHELDNCIIENYQRVSSRIPLGRTDITAKKTKLSQKEMLKRLKGK